MPDYIFKPSDLGTLEEHFNQLLAKYKLTDREPEVLDVLTKAILGQITDIDMPGELKQLIPDFKESMRMGYDLKINILDSKDLHQVKDSLERKVGDKFAPDIIVDEFLANLKNYKITDVNLKSRFDQAILSWLKGVRDFAELKVALTKNEKIGGIGMPEEVFEQLYDLLMAKDEEIKKEHVNMAEIIKEYEGGEAGLPQVENDIEIDSPGKIKPVPQKEKLTGADVTLAELATEKNIGYEELARKEEILKKLKQMPSVNASAVGGKSLASEIAAEEKFLEARPELMAPVKPEPVLPPAPTFRPQPVIAEYAAAATAPMGAQPAMKKVQVSGSRPMMEDIKFTPQLYSLTDELAALKIEDFRRLSKDPNEASQKIRAKLDLLEDESILKKVDGIKALKASPLYKIYANIMNRSIREGKSFDQVIAANPQISLAEFKAIMELNKSLKY